MDQIGFKISASTNQICFAMNQAVAGMYQVVAGMCKGGSAFLNGAAMGQVGALTDQAGDTAKDHIGALSETFLMMVVSLIETHGVEMDGRKNC